MLYFMLGGTLFYCRTLTFVMKLQFIDLQFFFKKGSNTDAFQVSVLKTLSL